MIGQQCCGGESSVKELQVPMALGMIIAQIERVETKLNNLQDRLKTVIRVEPENPKCLDKKNALSMVPLADQLRQYAERIENIAEEIENINRKIEI